MISENLIELILVRTEVKALPSSINNLTQLLHLDVRLCKNLQTIPKLSQFLKTLLASFSESLQSLPELPLSLETVHVKNWTSISTLPQFPPFLKTLEAGDCTSLKTLWSFPSTADEQLKENRKQETGSVRELLELGRKYSSGYWVECTNQHDEIRKPPPIYTKSWACWKLQWFFSSCLHVSRKQCSRVVGVQDKKLSYNYWSLFCSTFPAEELRLLLRPWWVPTDRHN